MFAQLKKKKVSLSFVRLCVFGIWVLSFVISLLFIPIAFLVQDDGVLSGEVPMHSASRIVTLYLPVFVSFVFFWFCNRKNLNVNRTVNRETAWAALSISVLCNAIIAFTLACIFLGTYNLLLAENVYEESLSGTLDSWLLSVIQLVAFIATAPLAYLLGVDSIS